MDRVPDVANFSYVRFTAGSASRRRSRSTRSRWHPVADGMYSAIVKAVKTREPERNGPPVIQPAATAGCCYVATTAQGVTISDGPVGAHGAGRD